ncbi:DUF1697 domain-containing protein [Devosia faecipullorum]|uniref:DUF1697 domain-containing protein n=1 Tax=Devosia faecipullorum TaxID=2755039 RepID=UPI00187B75F4|nr:DUF1697 domain-containing protein [Devosia faecipullorum]MBE7733292.1 DUF1697 domain-containing protein [Devosia faecipullorum]
MMARWGAFLRGINLGKRQMKMADLKACLETAGFEAVKTVLASGNVLVTAEGSEAEIRQRLETAIADQFDFKVGVVLRSDVQLQAMLAQNPFVALDPFADLTRHVLLFERPLPAKLHIEDRPGDTEILRVDMRELYIAAYKQPNGRYTEHVEDVLKPLYAVLDKGNLDTMRNWNTIEKILK